MANLSWHWYRRDRIGLLIAVEYINANDTIALRKKKSRSSFSLICTNQWTWSKKISCLPWANERREGNKPCIKTLMLTDFKTQAS